jgi:hypothetical protein
MKTCISSRGRKQVALLHAAVVEGAEIREIPVDFIERAHGKSKLGLSDIIEFVINIGCVDQPWLLHLFLNGGHEQVHRVADRYRAIYCLELPP